MKTCMFLCFHVNLKQKHKNMHVSMYFLLLVPTFTPQNIIMVKGSLVPRQATKAEVQAWARG